MTKEQFDLNKEATHMEAFCRDLRIKENRIAELKAFGQRCMDEAYEKSIDIIHEERLNKAWRAEIWIEVTKVVDEAIKNICTLQSPATRKEGK